MGIPVPVIVMEGRKFGARMRVARAWMYCGLGLSTRAAPDPRRPTADPAARHLLWVCARSVAAIVTFAYF